MKRKIIALSVITAMAFSFEIYARCLATYCGTVEIECTSGPCSTEVNEDGSGSITCGGNTIPVICETEPE